MSSQGFGGPDRLNDCRKPELVMGCGVSHYGILGRLSLPPSGFFINSLCYNGSLVSFRVCQLLLTSLAFN